MNKRSWSRVVPTSRLRECRHAKGGTGLRTCFSRFTAFPTKANLAACAGCAFSAFSANDRDGMKDCLPTGLLAESVRGIMPSAHSPFRNGKMALEGDCGLPIGYRPSAIGHRLLECR